MEDIQAVLWMSAGDHRLTYSQVTIYRMLLLNIQFKVDYARSGSSHLQLRESVLVYADMLAESMAYTKASR